MACQSDVSGSADFVSVWNVFFVGGLQPVSHAERIDQFEMLGLVNCPAHCRFASGNGSRYALCHPRWFLPSKSNVGVAGYVVDRTDAHSRAP